MGTSDVEVLSTFLLFCKKMGEKHKNKIFPITHKICAYEHIGGDPSRHIKYPKYLIIFFEENFFLIMAKSGVFAYFLHKNL